MSKRKLIVCNPGIFFEDNAPAVYPWLLDKLGRGEKARAIQAKYESIKADGPGPLPEMAELFKGINEIDMECRQYCWEYGRREVVGLFRRLNECGHRCMLVTSLPQEICTEFADLTRMISVPHRTFVSSQVLTCHQALISEGVSPKKAHLVDRESRKDIAIELIGIMLERLYSHQFHGWEDMLVIGQSLTDIPLGKAVQEKGGQFVAFHPKDEEILYAAERAYGIGMSLEEFFRKQGLM